MKLVVEISLYPLAEQYIEPIKAFIARLNTYVDISVDISRTSTVVEGDYMSVMTILGDEMQKTHKEVGQAIFVCKFLNGDKMSRE